LRDYGIRILSLADYPDLPDIPECGSTFLENALIKARAACNLASIPSLADDSGLEVDALGGLPGIRSARFAPTTEERNARLLELMRDVPDERRTARFVCALALIRPDGFEWTTLGICEGLITRAVSGAGGFGYDPLFLYPPLGLTFAEVPLAEKNRISHRGRALAAFERAVREEGILNP
jgi:XTP/dITP diphosphohydrolase